MLHYLKDINKNHRLKVIFLSGALLGGIIFLLLFGVHILDVTYVDRMIVRAGVEDLPQHYLAWEYFRNSAWSFPLGNINNLIYPDSISIVYSDSIPLFAIFFKLFNPILPTSFQYFGIWTLLCFMLQGAFASLITYRFSKSNIISLIYSVFFILSTIVLKRTFYHSALSAHWLILAAFAIWFYKNEFKSKKQVLILFTALNALTITIEAYFIPLIFGVMMCCLLQDVIDTKKFKLALATIVSSFVAILATAWIFGYFTSNISPATIGLGVFSFNLNGLFNSYGYSAIFPTLPLYVFGQDEGIAYLGLGIFILFGFSVIHLITRLCVACLKKRIKFSKILHFIPWIILLGVFTFFAVSPEISYGSKLLFTIHWPTSIFNILSIFRSSGRFIWPVFYAILIFCIYEFSIFYKTSFNIIKLKSKIKLKSILITIFLMMLLAVQLYDLSPFLKIKHQIITNDVVYDSPFKSDIWNELAKTHKYMYIYGPINELYDVYDVKMLSLYVEKFALDHHQILNAAYLSRDISAEKNIQVSARFDAMKQGAIYNDYMYIFPSLCNVPGPGFGLYYYEIDGIIVGVNTPINGIEELFGNYQN